MIQVLIGIFAVVIFGFLVADFLLPKGSVIERISLGYILGLGLFTFTLFLLGIIGIEFSLENSFKILILLIVISFIVHYLRKKVLGRKIFELNFGLRNEFSNLKTVERIVLYSTILLLLASFVSNLYWPVKDWDALTLYDFRAKGFVLTKTFENTMGTPYFYAYPFLTSLAHMFVYLLGGTNPAFIYSLFYVALVVVFYFLIRRFALRGYSLIFTFLLALSAKIFEQSHWAYTNLPYIAYLALGYIYLYLWVRTKKFGTLALSALLIGLSTWTRSAEPFWLTAVLAVVLFSPKKRRALNTFFYTIGVGIIRYSWIFYAGHHLGRSRSIFTPFKQALLSTTVPPSFKDFASYVSTNIISPYLFLFIAFLISSIIVLRNLNLSRLFLLFINYGNILVVFIGTYVFSITLPTWQDVGGSVIRMLLFFIPLFLFTVAIFINPQQGHKKGSFL